MAASRPEVRGTMLEQQSAAELVESSLAVLPATARLRCYLRSLGLTDEEEIGIMRLVSQIHYAMLRDWAIVRQARASDYPQGEWERGTV